MYNSRSTQKKKNISKYSDCINHTLKLFVIALTKSTYDKGFFSRVYILFVVTFGWWLYEWKKGFINIRNIYLCSQHDNVLYNIRFNNRFFRRKGESILLTIWTLHFSFGSVSAIHVHAPLTYTRDDRSGGAWVRQWWWWWWPRGEVDFQSWSVLVSLPIIRVWGLRYSI